MSRLSVTTPIHPIKASRATLRLSALLALLSVFAPFRAHAGGATWFGPQLKATPKRIVSLAPSTTELLFAVGAGDRVVAVTRYCDFPPQVTALPRVGGINDLNLEQVVGQRAELIVGIAARGADDIYKRLGNMGATVLVVANDTLGDFAPAVTAIADAVGLPARGRDVVTQFDQQMRHVRDMASGQRQRTAMILVGDHPIVAAGSGSFLDGAVKLLNLSNVVSQSGFPEISIETIASRDPEIIVDMADMRSSIISLGGHSRVVTIHDPRLVRLSPRLPAALLDLGPQVWL